MTIMEQSTLTLIVSRFDKIDKDLFALGQRLTEHTEKDERYWSMLDQQQAQLSLIKWAFGSTTLAGILLLAYNRLSGH